MGDAARPPGNFHQEEGVGCCLGIRALPRPYLGVPITAEMQICEPVEPEPDNTGGGKVEALSSFSPVLCKGVRDACIPS